MCVCVCVCVCVCELLSLDWLFATPWTVSNQPPHIYKYKYKYIYMVTNAYVEVSNNNDIMDVTEELGVF